MREREWARDLSAVWSSALRRRMLDEVVPRVRALAALEDDEARRDAVGDDDLDRLGDDLQDIARGQVEDTAGPYATVSRGHLLEAARRHRQDTTRQVQEALGRRLGRQLRRAEVSAELGVDLEAGEPWLADVVEERVQETLSRMAWVTRRAYEDAARDIRADVLAGVRVEEIARRLERDYRTQVADAIGLGRHRARFVARNELGNATAALTERRQAALGITQYVWRTSGDERVRGPGGKYPHAFPSHRAREGRVFSWSDPPSETRSDGHPGADFGCRCTAEPVLDDPPAQPSERDSGEPAGAQARTTGGARGRRAARRAARSAVRPARAQTRQDARDAARVRAHSLTSRYLERRRQLGLAALPRVPARLEDLDPADRALLEAVATAHHVGMEALRQGRSADLARFPRTVVGVEVGRTEAETRPLVFSLSAAKLAEAAATLRELARARYVPAAPGLEAAYRGVALARPLLDSLRPGDLVPMRDLDVWTRLPAVAEGFAASEAAGAELVAVALVSDLRWGTHVEGLSPLGATEASIVSGGTFVVERVDRGAGARGAARVHVRQLSPLEGDPDGERFAQESRQAVRRRRAGAGRTPAPRDGG